MKRYDYLIVGAGFYGATFARVMTDAGKTCLVIDRRSHVAGNAYTENIEGIDVHKYGPHIFHTDNQRIWSFVTKFGAFNQFINRPKALANGKLYSLPFNMNTFNQIWGCITPDDARKAIEKQQLKLDRAPSNLEEQALVLVGSDIYELLIKDYTEKQWQRHPKDLPPEIIKRLPLRFTFNDNYFNDRYQGIPVEGYTSLIENMLSGIDVQLNVDYLDDRQYWNSRASVVVFTGRIDSFFENCLGELEYRTLVFDTKIYEQADYQGTAVINYTDRSVPWTRVIEHKHFNPTYTIDKTVVTTEIPGNWQSGSEPYYPINTRENMSLLKQYQDLASKCPGVIFGGRLAEYRYYDMHQVVGSAMARAQKELD